MPPTTPPSTSTQWRYHDGRYATLWLHSAPLSPHIRYILTANYFTCHFSEYKGRWHRDVLCASTHPHYVGGLWVGGGGGGGMGHTWLRLHFASGALYESTCKRLQPVWLRPGIPRRADRQPSVSLTATLFQAPLANNSHSAGYQPPNRRINYFTAPVSLTRDTFYTTLIPNIDSFFFLF